jgi:HPt (histidine-containing phosphotransfer) domain-containing protein
MLKMLVDTFPAEKKMLTAAYSKNKWEDVMQVAHRLRGCTPYAGAYRLYTACANLENALTGKKLESQEKLYHSLLDEIANVEKAYQKLA